MLFSAVVMNRGVNEPPRCNTSDMRAFLSEEATTLAGCCAAPSLMADNKEGDRAAQGISCRRLPRRGRTIAPLVSCIWTAMWDGNDGVCDSRRR